MTILRVAYLAVILVAESFIAHTASAGVIPDDRNIDWSQDGVAGGIPARSTIGVTVDAAKYGNGNTDSSQAIQAAVDSCPENQVVYLPAGTYLLTSGVRSAKAVNLLKENGYKRVRNMKGGILAWSDTVDPAVPKY